MKALIQRVSFGKVTIVNTNETSSINKGIVILLGIKKGDTLKNVDEIISKILTLKFFSAKDKHFVHNLFEAQAEILVISQFTLYANLNKGTKPSFSNAEEPKKAEYLYHEFCDKLNKSGLNVKTGKFGAYMQVEIHNDGPVTLLLESTNDLQI
jgi:D-tyrosyl-tRNA(Tyr) deacylase